MQNNIITNKDKFIQQFNLTEKQCKQLYIELIDEDLKFKNEINSLDLTMYDIEIFKHFPRKNSDGKFYEVFYSDEKINY